MVDEGLRDFQDFSRDFTWHHPKLERNRTLSKRTNMNPNVFWPNPEFYG
jgi:hypothetical protein